MNKAMDNMYKRKTMTHDKNLARLFINGVLLDGYLTFLDKSKESKRRISILNYDNRDWWCNLTVLDLFNLNSFVRKYGEDGNLDIIKQHVDKI